MHSDAPGQQGACYYLHDVYRLHLLALPDSSNRSFFLPLFVRPRSATRKGRSLLAIAMHLCEYPNSRLGLCTQSSEFDQGSRSRLRLPCRVPENTSHHRKLGALAHRHFVLQSQHLKWLCETCYIALLSRRGYCIITRPPPHLKYSWQSRMRFNFCG